MSLQGKVLSLKLQAAIASRHALFWEKQIAQHGESKATAFYSHLGLNHLEKKSVEWEGLTLSREPKDHEKLCIKGIHAAQESSKERVTKILLEARTELIADGLKRIKKLPVAKYHELTLSVSTENRAGLRDQLVKVYQKGRRLLDSELADQRLQSGKSTAREYLAMKDDASEDDLDELDTLTDLTDARIANEIQSRIASAAVRYTLLGLTGKALWDAVEKEVGEGSTGWLDRAATGVSNKVINLGRTDEAESRKDEWQSVEYSAILDANVCEECAPLDGETATNEDDLEPVPLASCLGGDFCRCLHVYIAI